MNQTKKLKAKNDRLLTERTKIWKGTVITIEHILAIICYTDNDNLCYEFRKSFRNNNDDGSPKNAGRLVYDNSEFGHWGRLLHQCVYVYGNNINFKHNYYHGLNQKLIFDEFAFNISLPISTSIDVNVANNFMGVSGGMVVTFKNKYDIVCDYRCLSVKLFSKFKEFKRNKYYFFVINLLFMIYILIITLALITSII